MSMVTARLAITALQWAHYTCRGRKKLTWQQLILWLARLYCCADKGNPHVLGCNIVLVRAAEDVDV